MAGGGRGEMRELQAGHNLPLPEAAVDIVLSGEPADELGQLTRPVAFLLGADGRAAAAEDAVDEAQPHWTGEAVRFDAGHGRFHVVLPAVPLRVERIAITLTLRSGPAGGMALSRFRGIAATLLDAAGAPIARFVPEISGREETALILVELYRRAGQWKARAVGQGFIWGLAALARHYGLDWRDAGPGPGPAPAPPAPDFSAGRRSGGPAFSGTGFCVSRDGYFVTNAHVVEDASTFVAVSPRDRYPLRHVFSDPSNDLALLKTDQKVPAVATFRDGLSARLGEAVMTIGYPLGGLLGSGPQVTTGNISSLIGLADDTRALQFTAPVQRGNSGGPLLDSGGAVVGVVCAKLDAARIQAMTGDLPQNVNFAIKSAVVRSFLEALGIDHEARPGGASRSTAEIAHEAQGFVVRIECHR